MRLQLTFSYCMFIPHPVTHKKIAKKRIEKKVKPTGKKKPKSTMDYHISHSIILHFYVLAVGLQVL